MVKNLPANAGDAKYLGLIPGSGRPPGGGNDQWLRYYCLEKFHGQRSLAGYSPWGWQSRTWLGMQALLMENGKCLKAQRTKNLEKLTLVWIGTSFLHHCHHEVKQSWTGCEISQNWSCGSSGVFLRFGIQRSTWTLIFKWQLNQLYLKMAGTCSYSHLVRRSQYTGITAFMQKHRYRKQYSIFHWCM